MCNAYIGEFDITEDKCDVMMDTFMQLEIDAFNVDTEWPDENSNTYKRYMQYGWL